ncbi:MAG: CBS domain-containing protein [Halanaeroarchaeum sp.]
MDISDIVISEFETVDADARASSVQSRLQDGNLRAVVVMDDGEYRGLVTPRQLLSGSVDPDAKAAGYVWHVARVRPRDDVRTVAARMVGSVTRVLPVFEGTELVGLVTAEGILEAVQPFLGVLSVRDVFTEDPETLSPDTTIGQALHEFREHGVGHFPVVGIREVGRSPEEQEEPSGVEKLVGVLSIRDVLGFVGREMERASGGTPGDFGTPGSGRSGVSHGGFGERAGDIDRMLDVPVENVMSDTTATTGPGASLDDAVAEMLDLGISSLVVATDDLPVGIVTWTDVLEVLTLTGEERLPVQITNIDLMDDMSRAELSELIEGVASKHGRMRVLEANVYLHEHDETLRGTPLILARVRLFTDKGHFVGTGEGYGASHAIRLAANVLERSILEGKDYGRTKKHPDPEALSKIYGWWLEGSPPQR